MSNQKQISVGDQLEIIIKQLEKIERRLSKLEKLVATKTRENTTATIHRYLTQK